MISSSSTSLAKRTASQNLTIIDLPTSGLLPQKLRHYVPLMSNPLIRLICTPLEKININYFLYVKRFSDSSFIYLTNHPNWLSYFFENNYYLIDDFNDPDRNYQTGAFLWGGQSQCEQIYTDLREKFNISHGITLLQSYQDCSEFFHFGSKDQNYFISNAFLNNYEILKRFTLYFKDKAYEMIRAMSTCRIKVPKRPYKAEYDPDWTKKQVQEFIHLTKIDRYYICYEKSDTYLTKREMECLKWYSIGKTAEETGMILGLSKRTVESYLSNAKTKINCFKKAQVIYNFNSDLL